MQVAAPISNMCFLCMRAQAALDRGLEALRLLNSSYAAQLAEMRAVREERGDRSGVRFSVGQVFIHKKVGKGACNVDWWVGEVGD